MVGEFSAAPVDTGEPFALRDEHRLTPQTQMGRANRGGSRALDTQLESIPLGHALLLRVRPGRMPLCRAPRRRT